MYTTFQAFRTRACLVIVLVLAGYFRATPTAGQALYDPVFKYAIFYNDLLEFSTCASMTINGPVHCNGNIYVGAGSGADLNFNDTITCVGTISAPENNGSNWGDPTNFNSATWRTYFNGAPPYLTNAPPVNFLLTNNFRSIIEMPSVDDWNTEVGQQRLYNKAHIVLLVSNATVTLRIRQAVGTNVPAADPSPVTITSTTNASVLGANFPFLNLTNRFYDRRESKTNITTQIDVGRYAAWLTTNAQVNAKFPAGLGMYPTILYVADNRTAAANRLTSVRLTNGVVPPHNGGQGFALATPNPLYVWGNFNCTNPAYLGTTNTAASLPCALYSDALTLLSSSWRDSQSTSSYTVRVASPTDTVNAAIVTGLVPSTGSGSTRFSGGIHNLPRLLEDWRNSTLWLNTSLVNLFTSARATNRFINPGTYYAAPERRFNFDLNFTDPSKLPPGTPILVVNPYIYIYADLQDQAVTAGQDATLSVLVYGPGEAFYQWRFNGADIPGATNASLLIANADADDAGIYSVLVTNSYMSVTSSNATLTVNYAPTITGQPASVNALAEGEATFEVTAEGTAPMSYQWYFNQTNALAGATNAMLHLANLGPQDTGEYSVMILNPGGWASSMPAGLIVYPSSIATLSLPDLSGGHPFQLQIAGVPGFRYAVEASSNLIDWVSLGTNASPFNFMDLESEVYPQRFYRARFVP